MNPEALLPVSESTKRRSKHGAMLVFILTVIGASVILGLAAWPGLLDVKLFDFLSLLVTLPLLGFWFLLVLCVGVDDLTRKPDSDGKRNWWGLTSLAVIAVAIGLILTSVPQRFTLLVCLSEFRRLVTAEADRLIGEPEIRWQLGPYSMDRCRTDRNGGVFLRTAAGRGLFRETSYGFAFQPNGRQAPFGNAEYSQQHLFGDWYAFAVTNDFDD